MIRLRLLALAIGALGLSGCNTLIGVGRDVKEGYHWTAGKIRGDGQPAADDYGAPVY